MKYFYLEEYQPTLKESKESENALEFGELCAKIKTHFEQKWMDSNSPEETSQFLKRCLVGEEIPVTTLRHEIDEYLRTNQLTNSQFPAWYETLVDGVYHENWGLAGLAEFYTQKYKNCSSAKVIGDKVYFLQNGKMVLKPQRITKNRREQLVRAMLIHTPEERLDKDNHEIYMIDGSRLEIYNEQMTKKGQDTIIIRRYIVPNFTFEEQAARGTIPKEAIPLFESMVKLGLNVAFTGAVRTAKTTMLSTWQSYEDPTLEGVMVETDPEIPLHQIMPEAPIIQIVADDDRLANIVKPIMRSDADYIVMAEARNGLALHIAVSLANKGTKRVKITYHTRDAEAFCYDVGAEIASYTKQDLEMTVRRVARSFDFIFHMIQLPNKSQKRLEGIYELHSTLDGSEHIIENICKYNPQTDSWSWRANIDERRADALCNENPEAFHTFFNQLRALEQTKEKNEAAKGASVWKNPQ